jgi:hypothetical protein
MVLYSFAQIQHLGSWPSCFYGISVAAMLVPLPKVCLHVFLIGIASAWTSDPGASVGRIVSRRIWIKTSISRRSGEARVQCCEKLLRCCGSYYSMLRTSSVQHPTREVSIDVASLCVSCCERQGSQHSVFRGKIAQGRTGSLPRPGSRLPRGGEGRRQT